MIWPSPDHLGDYMRRWWVFPFWRSHAWWFNIRIHHILRSDAGRDLHDHPWNYLTIILRGGYFEHTEDGRKWHGPGTVLYATAKRRHRLELPPGQTAWTLFFFGRRWRQWGFQAPGGWIPWTNYGSKP